MSINYTILRNHIKSQQEGYLKLITGLKSKDCVLNKQRKDIYNYIKILRQKLTQH